MNSGITGAVINKLTIDDQDNLYTMTTHQKIFKSTDDGLTWNEVYSYNYPNGFYDIKAGINGLIIASGTNLKILVTTDYGQTWNIRSHPNMSAISHILIVSNYEIYATDGNDRIWKSIDAGLNWFMVSLAPTNQYISSIKKDSDNNLFLGVMKFQGLAGIGGVFKSTDNGQTWGPNLYFNLINKQVMTIEFIDGDKVWIGTSGCGVQELVSPDSLWIKKNSGMNDIDINSIAFDNDNNMWICTSNGGIFYSNDSGNNWEERSYGLEVPAGFEIKVASDNSVFLADAIALSKYNYIENKWIKKPVNPWGYFNCLEIKNRDTIFAGDPVGGIAVSFDNGETWAWDPPMYLGTNSIKLLKNGDLLAPGTYVYKTTNNGTSWQYFYSCGQPMHIKVEQTEEGFLLTAADSGDIGFLFLSIDNGQTQINLTGNINNPELSALKLDINDRILLGTKKAGIFLTTDYGNLWTSVNEGLDNLYIRSFEINDSGFVFVGTSEGLYRSTIPYPVPVELTSFNCEIYKNNVKIAWETATEVNNRGFEIQRMRDNENWVTIGFKDGKGTISIPQSYSFTDKDLLSGKYRYRLKQVDFNGAYSYSQIVEALIDDPVQSSLYQNYPNPFNPVTKIKYQLSESAKVKLRVFNALGEDVKTLINEEQQAGTYEIEFNGNGLPSGVYYNQLTAGNYVQIRKMILLK